MSALSNEQACRIVARAAGSDPLVITMSTMKVLPGVAPQARFVSCVPLMGGASSMGLGIALARPDLRVWVLDGDASLLMELGSLVTVAEAAPRNLVHLVFDNAVQFGGTANLAIPRGGAVDFCGMAKAAGYREALRVDSEASLEQALAALPAAPGPILLQVLVAPDPAYYSQTTPQREIPDNQLTRMGDEARRMRAALGAKP
jgi:thiamine pyrophosphate-dependent acetolactate synthase large subunit-like protein